MNGSRNIWFLKLAESSNTVFSINSLRMLLGEIAPKNLSVLLNRAVQKGLLLNPRRGIYAKPGYNPEELACMLYPPCYLSLEYVLQQAGMVFQYSETLTCVSYQTRTVEIDGRDFSYRRIKGEIMVDTRGIEALPNGINKATVERAFLDTLYLNSNYTFDSLRPLNKAKIKELLPIYDNKALNERVNKLLS